MIIRCERCRAEITGEYRFRVEDGKAFCVTHIVFEGHTDSQAGEPQTGDGCLRPAEQEQGNGE